MLELARQPAVIEAMKHSGIGGAYSTNTYAMIFLAGLLKEYRPLAEDWGRIRRCGSCVCHDLTNYKDSGHCMAQDHITLPGIATRSSAGTI